MYSTFLLSGSLTKSGNFFSISSETPIWEFREPVKVPPQNLYKDYL